MITYEEALDEILEHTAPTGQKRVRLEHILGYVLAEPVVARFELPHFDNSAVDGFGVKLADVAGACESNPASLKLTHSFPAGHADDAQIEPGCAVKILTGAMVPSSCEAVVMREFCQEKGDSVLVKRAASPGENIRRRGEEFSKGQEVLARGVRITPPVVGLLASFGYASYPVHEKPRVGLVVTGNELVKPGTALSPGQIYNANAYSLQAALLSLGIEEFSSYHALDTRKSTRQNLLLAIDQSNLVITSGGVSVGDHDYVKEVLEDIGVKTVFWRVAIKPGKPVYFGVLEQPRKKPPKLIFGLPGNPVSVLVTFQQFVRPALLRMMGMTDVHPKMLNALSSGTMRKKAGRLDFVRGRLESDGDARLIAHPTRGQDSHMLSGLSQAECLMHFPLEAERLDEKEEIPVQLLDWS